MLVPDLICTRNTLQTIKNTTDPVFKERFLFSLEPDELLGRVLNLQVYAIDKYARQKVIGEADIRLGDLDLSMAIKMWLNLRDIDEVSVVCSMEHFNS